MNVEHISDNELKEFIFAQPRDKEINMEETRLTDSCGCILVQFARSKGFSQGQCGWHTVNDFKSNKQLEIESKDIVLFAFEKPVTNFGELQDRLK